MWMLIVEYNFIAGYDPLTKSIVPLPVFLSAFPLTFYSFNPLAYCLRTFRHSDWESLDRHPSHRPIMVLSQLFWFQFFKYTHSRDAFYTYIILMVRKKRSSGRRIAKCSHMCYTFTNRAITTHTIHQSYLNYDLSCWGLSQGIPTWY